MADDLEWITVRTARLEDALGAQRAWAAAVPSNAQAGYLRITWPDILPDWLTHWLATTFGPGAVSGSGNVTNIALDGATRQAMLTSLSGAQPDALLTVTDRSALLSELAIQPVALPLLAAGAVAIRAALPAVLGGLARAWPAILRLLSNWGVIIIGLLIAVPKLVEAGAGTVGRAAGGAISGFLGEISAWAKANPEMAAVAGVGLLLVLRR